MREGETVSGLRMSKTGRIEVEAKTILFCPGDPVLEVLWLDFIAIHFPAIEFAVHRVKVHPVPARDERERFLQISAKFVGRPGLAGVIAGDSKATTQRAA